MNTEPIKISASLEKVATMADGGLRLNFNTQELDAQKAGELMAIKNVVGWLIFATYGTEQVEIPEEPPTEFVSQKSPSERLRNVLYRLWEKKGKAGEFEEFRRVKMEKIITHFKDQLE